MAIDFFGRPLHDPTEINTQVNPNQFGFNMSAPVTPDPNSFMSGVNHQVNRMTSFFNPQPQGSNIFNVDPAQFNPASGFNQAVGITPSNISLDQYNQQRGWWGEMFGGTPLTDAQDNIQLDPAGNPIMIEGITGMDVFNIGAALGQGALNWFMGDRQLDVAEGQLDLKKQAYADTRADQRRLDEAYQSYGRG